MAQLTVQRCHVRSRLDACFSFTTGYKKERRTGYDYILKDAQVTCTGDLYICLPFQAQQNGFHAVSVTLRRVTLDYTTWEILQHFGKKPQTRFVAAMQLAHLHVQVACGGQPQWPVPYQIHMRFQAAAVRHRNNALCHGSDNSVAAYKSPTAACCGVNHSCQRQTPSHSQHTKHA